MDVPQGPLLRSRSEESTASTGSRRGGSNRQAFKVAGLTLLAAVLIAGQAFTAYMMYSQKEKLTSLESRSDRLEELSRKASVMRAPVKMAVPMRSLPMVLDEIDTNDKNAPSTPAPKKDTMTKCQEEAASVSSFKPQCDEQGDYLPQQCMEKPKLCWCVDENGEMLPESVVHGPAQCNADAAQ